MNLNNVFFQYQSCYHLNNIYGYEALLRENIKSKACLPVQLLENINSNNYAQYYLFNKLFSDIRKSKILQDKKISINISCLFISNHIFDIKKINIQGVNLTNITIEISECDDFINNVTAKFNFNQLHRLGFSIAMDDFGIKHSTFYRLNSFMFDVVKLDKSLIKNQNSIQLKQFINDIYIINNKIRIICEGVETFKELCLLKTLGIEYYQGFYFSKPENINNLNV